jgi:hypothetical protein
VGITASQPQTLLDQVQDLTQSYPSQRLPDVRRLSVSSLLSTPPGRPYLRNQTTSNASDEKQFESPPSPPYYAIYDATTTWGIDRGIKDLDIGRNDDMNAITGSSPVDNGHLEHVTGIGGFRDGYYDKPVPINIPRILEPLPTKLLENPMNLLVGSFSSFVQITLLTPF